MQAKAPLLSASAYLGIPTRAFSFRSPATESPRACRVLGTLRVGGVATSHDEPRPAWFAWSPAVSGSSLFDTRTLDTVADGPLKGRCVLQLGFAFGDGTFRPGSSSPRCGGCRRRSLDRQAWPGGSWRQRGLHHPAYGNPNRGCGSEMRPPGGCLVRRTRRSVQDRFGWFRPCSPFWH